MKFWYLYYRCKSCGALTRPYSFSEDELAEVRLELLGIAKRGHHMHDKIFHQCDDNTLGLAELEKLSTDATLATDYL